MIPPHTPPDGTPQDEIEAVTAFYKARGWDWLMVVAFLSARAVGMWPLPDGWVIRMVR